MMCAAPQVLEGLRVQEGGVAQACVAQLQEEAAQLAGQLQRHQERCEQATMYSSELEGQAPPPQLPRALRVL